MRIIKDLLILIGVLSTGIVIYAISTTPPTPASNKTGVVETSVSTASAVNDSLTPAEEGEYMNGCMAIGNQSYCQCTYDYLDDFLTNDQFRSMSRDYLNDKNDVTANKWILEASQFCVRENV